MLAWGARGTEWSTHSHGLEGDEGQRGGEAQGLGGLVFFFFFYCAGDKSL